MLKRICIVLAIILMVSVVAEVIQAFCPECPQCGNTGMIVNRYQLNYTWICVYRCLQGHSWQCQCTGF